MSLQADIVVIGAGFGGMVAAVRAAELGRKTLIIEARADVGGTAMYSGGGVHIWGAQTWEDYRKTCPLADPVLAKTLFDQFMPFVDWAVATGAPGAWNTATTRGLTLSRYQLGQTIASPGRAAWFAYMRRRFEKLGGAVITGARARRLLKDGAQVCGVEAERGGETLTVHAAAVILSAGGFQNSPQRLARHFGPGAYEFVNRGAPENVGDALDMALEAGAAESGPMDTLYGHLMPAPPCRPDPSNTMDYLLLSAFYAEHGVVVNAAGQRFVDEGDGELTGATINAAARQPAGGLWIVMDEAIRKQWTRYELPAQVLRLANLPLIGLSRYCGLRWSGLKPSLTVDSLAYARDRGALIISAPSLGELAEALGAHGVDGAALLETLAAFNADVVGGQANTLPIPKIKHAHRIDQGPFHAVKAAVGVSMTYGGVRIAPDAQVLDASNYPIPGLYATPGAAGGIHYLHYAGALAACGVFGKIAAEQAADHIPV